MYRAERAAPASVFAKCTPVAQILSGDLGTTRKEANSMAGQQSPASTPTGSSKARGQAKPVVAQQQQPEKSLSGLTPEQAKEFHEQFKVTYTAYVGIAALVHLFVIASNPWF
ncbi:Antenna complex alpha/beta subunit [Thiocapsa roseopersicina]|uniref:Antenna complex alpha/beta subunit n=1 Tax=Thiocapsa roseopersicina TaxID=1058 RepID=A0A1H2ST63_THIRO|nr:Antenna complex alpha/beta subunit [Thiocapsa roseopersicina]